MGRVGNEGLSGSGSPGNKAITPTISEAITLSAAGAALTLSSATGAIAFGATPSTTGLLRVPNNVTAMAGRNAANTADVDMLLLSGTNIVRLGPGAISVQISGGSGSIGFFGTTPVVQGAAVADATGGATIDAEARTAINAALARLRGPGFIAT